MNSAWWFRFSLWLVTFYALLLTLSLTLGQYYGRLMLPYYGWSLSMINQNYKLLDLILIAHQNQTHISAKFQQANTRMIQGTLLPAGPQLNSSTLLGHALVHPILVISPILAWWRMERRRLPHLLFGGLIALLGVELLDIPFVLLGSIEDLLLVNIDKSLPAQSGLVTWMHFLNGGGRLGLCLFAAAMLLYYEHARTKQS